MSNYLDNPRLGSTELRKLIPVFMDEIVEDVMRLELAFNIADYQICLELLHKIKGTSISFGVLILGDKTKAFREYLQENKYDVASVELNSIKIIIKELQEEVQKMP
ncbi:MAG: hypothetical protein ACJAV5_000401 [Vicingaceae bacterium]|jgi:hypothetical protein